MKKKKPKFIVEVVEAKYIEKHKIEVVFNDNTRQTIDFGKWLKTHPHPQHNKYRSIELFKQFYIEGGNLLWGKNWDLVFHILSLYNNDLTGNYDY